MPLQTVVQGTSCFEFLLRNQFLSSRSMCGEQAREVGLLMQACTIWASGQPTQIPSWQPNNFQRLWGQLFALGPAELASHTEEDIFIPPTTCLSS